MNNKLIIECLGFEKGKAFGFQEYLFNLLNYFHEHRIELLFSEVIIVCKPSQVQNFILFSRNFTVLGVKGSESYLGRLWKQTTLPFLLGLKKNDVILFPGNFSGLIKRCHHILVVHDLLYKRRYLIKNFKMVVQRELFVRQSIRLADKVIGISNFVSNDIKRYFPKDTEKVVPIYNYMNFEKFGCGPTDDDNDYFIGVAANYPHKNLSTLFIAFERYCNDGGTKNLKLVGRVNEESDSGKIFNSLPSAVKDRIKFTPDITNEELGALYQHASAFISTSLFEGFGMPIAEAMFFNLPLLLSDIEIHHEISMEQGCFFKPQNAEALAYLMLNIKNIRINYGKDVVKRYDSCNTSAKYLILLNAFTR